MSTSELARAPVEYAEDEQVTRIVVGSIDVHIMALREAGLRLG